MRALAWTLCLSLIGASARADVTAAKDDGTIEEARALDQQGVRAYKDGRYKDAIVYFEQARKLGGPSSEVWNVAKCHLKLDEPEAAHEALDTYLAETDLTPEDRADALAQRDALDHRTSPLTVTSTPVGARVLVDGKLVGGAPVTLDVTPGEHQVRVQQDGYSPYSTSATARFGRAIVLSADLVGHEGGRSPEAAPGRIAFILEGGLGVTAARYGNVGGGVMPMGYVLGTLPLLESERWSFGVGLRFGASGEAWGTSAGVSNVALSPTCKPPSDYSAASVLFHAVGSVGLHVTPKLKVGADAGFGVATITASDVGGDVFVPQCSAAPGVQPAVHAALSASYSVLPRLRAVARPLILDVQPAYDGTRANASSAWLRFGFTLGAAVEL